MTKSTITREQLEEWVAQFDEDGGCDATDSQLEALIRQSLAAMDSEPVIIVGDDGGDALSYRRLIQSFEPGTKLYRHAQPAPVVPAVSDDIGEIRVGRLPTMNQDDYPGLGDWWVQLRIGEDSDEVLARVYGATPQEANNRAQALACRAAMLKAGTLTNEGTKLAGSSPVVPVLTRADFENWCQKTFALSPSYFEKDANGVYMSTLVHDLYVAWEGCRAAMLNGSNGRKKIRVMALGASIAYGVNSLMSLGRSPVIPDGYVMVPKDLLSDLRDWAHPEIEKYCEMWEGRRDSEFPALRKVITDADALLAAGPQLPGSEPATVPGKWIPVSERMPESNGVYFGWDGKRVLEVNCFFGGFSANQFIHGEITHWMPMPAPPQEGK